MGLRVAANSSRVMVVYGDLVFNSEAIKHVLLEESCVVVTDQGMGEEEVGMHYG